MKPVPILLSFALLAVGVAIGRLWLPLTMPSNTQRQTPANAPLVDEVRVRAQGRLLPRGGLINVYVPPNQRVQSILVAQGQSVVAGETELARVVGLDLVQLQAELAEAQFEDRVREFAQKTDVAAQQVVLAETALRLAELQKQEAQSSRRLEIPRQQLQAATAKLARLESLSADPNTEAFVTQTALEDQRLKLTEAKIQLAEAERQQTAALEAAELERAAAESAWEQAKQSHAQLLEWQNENRTGRLAVEVAQRTAEQARLLAPIDGEVVRVLANDGEVPLQTPLMQIANLDQMVCMAEVPDRMIGRLVVGQQAMIESPALASPIRGSVARIGRVVGNSTLRDPNPLAIVDRQTVAVEIRLDASDLEIAARLLDLQVTVTFEAGQKP